MNLEHRKTIHKCELCRADITPATLNSRFGGGNCVDGVWLCNKCERDKGRQVIKRYQNATKKFLTDGERQKIIETRTVR